MSIEKINNQYKDSLQNGTKLIATKQVTRATTTKDKLFAPNDTVVSTLEKMKNSANTSMVDYTTTAYYILQKLYKDNKHVRQACRTFANSISQCIPQFAIESTKSIKDNNIIDSLSKLLRRPNKHETWQTMVRKLGEALPLFGNAYWQIVYNGLGNIHSIYSLPPQSIRPIPFIDEQTGELSFVYCQLISNDGINYTVNRVFTEQEIIHFKTDNIFSLLYGLSAFSALFHELEFDVKTQNYLNNYMKNAFSGGMIFEIKDTDEEIVQRNREELQESLTGVENAGRNMILEGNIRVVTEGNKAKDFPLQQLAEINKDAIYTCAGVPLTMAGIRSENGKLNAELVESEEQIFLKNIMTYQDIIFSTINSRLIQDILKYKDIEIKAGVNRHFSLKRAESMVETLLKVGCTVNEARNLLGLPNLEDKKIGSMLIIGTNNGVIPLETFFDNLSIDKEIKLLNLQNFNNEANNTNNIDETKQPSLKVSQTDVSLE